MIKLFYKPYLYYNLYIRNKIHKKRTSYSQFKEDLFINNYFKNKSIGFYVDIGCYHPVKYSNTALIYNREGHDYEVIEGFNLTKYKPKLICIELFDTKLNINEKYFRDFLSTYNYSLIEKIGPNGIFCNKK